MKEIEIQKSILDWLGAAGYWYRRIPLGGVLQTRGSQTYLKKNDMVGMPDIMGILKNKPGHVFFIEVKTHSGKLTLNQKFVQKQLIKAGAVYILARSLVTVIEALKYDKPSNLH